MEEKNCLIMIIAFTHTQSTLRKLIEFIIINDPQSSKLSHFVSFNRRSVDVLGLSGSASQPATILHLKRDTRGVVGGGGGGVGRVVYVIIP